MELGEIQIRQVTKRYQLGSTRGHVTRLSEAISERLRRRSAPAVEYRLALDNVSFDVRPGEVMGLIGRNGAGKSTLLKILSRVTTPDSGEILVKGRIGSLLEVGTGFHPELTGYENVFLSGSLLGMRRAEIEAKLDQIVEFAGLADFLSTPVKRYSSGMYMRLAFSVAAHLEPEILLVDEVLAVGDAEFQAKCIGRMGELSRAGRTVVFVSHNMAAIAKLTTQCAVLDKGKLVGILPTAEAVRTYLQTGESGSCWVTYEAPSDDKIMIRGIAVISREGTARREFSCDEPPTFRLWFQGGPTAPRAHCAILIETTDGAPVLFSDIRDDGGQLGAGQNVFEIRLPPRLLAPGSYSITVGVAAPFYGMLDRHEAACSFTIVDHSTERGNERPGVIGLRLAWGRAEMPFEPASGER